MSENHFIDYGKMEVMSLVHPERVIVDFQADLIFSQLKIKNTSVFRSKISIILKHIGVYEILKKIYHAIR
jgi:hypothetical protein